jgi:hypothetical protein
LAAFLNGTARCIIKIPIPYRKQRVAIIISFNRPSFLNLGIDNGGTLAGLVVYPLVGAKSGNLSLVLD